ncbi:cupin domain-containing protein [Jiulongibacter sp. NS-SX5]|uniref:cupin domain-containing protein n=1 Tax=Jiulongibacter sp. NS-SX5 TaxID=3463854 RepID=UPI004058182F
MKTAAYWIEKLHLNPHPEGGYFSETYRSELTVKTDDFGMPGKRNFATGIYFLMEKQNFSAFHRIKSDEMWHFYAGDPLEVFFIDSQGAVQRILLGNNPENGEVFQAVVPAGVWFGSRPVAGGSYSLVGCTVSPGFDFQDFEMAKRATLKAQYPEHQRIIEELTRD